MDLGLVADELPGIGIVFAIIGFALFAVVFLVPLLLVLVDVLLLVLLVGVGIAARVLFRRPWRIEAVSFDGRRLTWNVTGYLRSGEKMREIVLALQRGARPSGDDGRTQGRGNA